MSSSGTVVSLRHRGQDVLGYGPLRVWLAVREWETRHGYPPGVRDLAAVFGVQTFAVVGHLRRLRRAGLLDWEAGRARTIRTTARLEVMREAKGGA